MEKVGRIGVIEGKIGEKVIRVLEVSRVYVLLQSLGLLLFHIILYWILSLIEITHPIVIKPIGNYSGITYVLAYLFARALMLVFIFVPLRYLVFFKMSDITDSWTNLTILIMVVCPYFLDQNYRLLLLAWGLIASVLCFIRYTRIKYIMTNYRMIIKDSWISQKSTSLSYTDIIDVVYYRSFWGRLFKYGSVIPIRSGMKITVGVQGLGLNGVVLAPSPDFDNAFHNIEDAERVWNEIASLVVFRKPSTQIEIYGKEIAEELRKIREIQEGRIGRVRRVEG